MLSTLPTYVLRIGGNERHIGLIIGAFATSSLVFRIPVGRVLDSKCATKGLILSGTIIFLISSLLYNLANTVPTLLAIRLLHGSGIAAYTTAASTLVAHTVPQHRRGEAMGVFATASAVSFGLGPALGVVILQHGGYHAVWAVSTGFALLGLLLALPIEDYCYAARHSIQQRTDGIICIEAVFPSLIIFAACLTYGAAVSFLALFTIERHLGNAGTFFLIYAFCLIITRGPAGRISDRYGRAVVIAPGMAFLAAAMFILSHAHSLAVLAAAAAVYGLGFACVHSPLMAMAIDRVTTQRRGAAMGVFTAGFELGIAVGSAAFGAFLPTAGFAIMFQGTGIVASIGCAGFLLGKAFSKRNGERLGC